MVDAIFIGMEASNGYVKATSNVTWEVDSYLNTLTPVSKEVYEASKNTDEEVYSFQEGLDPKIRYFKVGKTITSDEQIYFSSDAKSKYTETNWVAANMIAVYRQLKSVDIHNTPIYLLTGVPTDHSRDEDLKKDIKEVLTKTYTINEKIIKLTDASVLPQADASFFNDLLLLDKDLNIEINEEFIKETTPDVEDQQSVIIYFDLGFGTGDIKTVIDYNIVPEKSKQIPGMEAQWVKVMNEAVKKNPELAGIEIMAVEKQLQKGGKISINNESVNVDLERDSILMDFGQYCIGLLEKAPFKGMLKTQIRFVGGGPIVMKPYIRESLKDKYKSNPKHIEKFKFVNNSQGTNCLGFFKMCVKKYKGKKQ